jgi:hypothetical protein
MRLKLMVLTFSGALLAGSVQAQTVSAPRAVRQEVVGQGFSPAFVVRGSTSAARIEIDDLIAGPNQRHRDAELVR